MKQRIDRRTFLLAGSGALAGLAAGCPPRRVPAPSGDFPLPHLEVSGTPFECGRAIGRRFGRQIRLGLERRADWFRPLRDFMLADKPGRCDGFLAAAREHFPDIVEELEGSAEGSGVDFYDLAALNLKAELGAMMARQRAECPGCSTLALSHGGRMLLAHNEDGHAAYADLMFLLTVRQPGKRTVRPVPATGCSTLGDKTPNKDSVRSTARTS